jgi:hypothetical protein
MQILHNCGIIDTPTKDNIMTLTSYELQLLSNTEVLGYIQAKNVERNAQAKAEGWTFWTLMAEGIATEFANAYQLELSFARGAYSDIHKEVWGCRGYVREEHTLEQVEAEIEELSEMAAVEYKAEQEWHQSLDAWSELSMEDELEEWEVYEDKAEAAGY